MNMDANKTIEIHESLMQVDPLRHYSVKESAAILHLSEDDVYRFLRSGDLKGRRTSKKGNWRIQGQSLLTFRFMKDTE